MEGHRFPVSRPLETLGDVEVAGALSPGSAAAAGESGRASLGSRVFQNTFALLAGRVAGLLLSIATSVILARYLGREKLGTFGALYAYLTLYTWLATFGLEQILAREAAQRRGEAGGIFFTGSVVGLAFALAGTAFALLLAPTFGYAAELRLLLLFAAVDVLLLPPLRLAGIVFQVDMRQWYAVGVGLFRQVLWLLAVVLAMFGRAELVWVVAGRTLCAVAEAGVVLILVSRKDVLPRPWTLSWDQARKFIGYAFPLALSAVAVGIYHRIDQVMLHRISGDLTLGPYVVAVQMTELFSALPVALMSSLFPVLARAAGQEEQFRHYLGVSYRFLMAVVFAACALATPVAAPLVELFYGPDFRATSGLLVVLIWSEVPVFFGVVLANAIVAKNLQRYLPISTIAGAIINIGLNLVLIPRWGALGASWATVVSYSAAGIFLFLVIPQTRRIAAQGLRIALPPFLLALGIAFALTFLPGAFWLKLGLGAVAYAAGAWLTGTVKRGEIAHTWQFIRGNIAYLRA